MNKLINHDLDGLTPEGGYPVPPSGDQASSSTVSRVAILQNVSSVYRDLRMQGVSLALPDSKRAENPLLMEPRELRPSSMCQSKDISPTEKSHSVHRELWKPPFGDSRKSSSHLPCHLGCTGQTCSVQPINMQYLDFDIEDLDALTFQTLYSDTEDDTEVVIVPWKKKDRHTTHHPSYNSHNRRQRPKNKRHGKKFDSTLGYPGEGPGFSDRLKELCDEEKKDLVTCTISRCGIAGHYHPNKPYGPRQRAQAERKADRKPGKNKWYLCEEKVTGNDCIEKHGHSENQNYHSQLQADYLALPEDAWNNVVDDPPLEQPPPEYHFEPEEGAPQINLYQPGWDDPIVRLPPVPVDPIPDEAELLPDQKRSAPPPPSKPKNTPPTPQPAPLLPTPSDPVPAGNSISIMGGQQDLADGKARTNQFSPIRTRRRCEL